MPTDSKQYQLIALDLDGTLLSPTGRVTSRTRAAVHAALDAGLRVCFATGRNWTESRMVLDEVDHYPHAVFAGGALVMDTRQEVTLHRTHMAPDLARKLCITLSAEGHSPLALQDTQEAGVDYLVGPNLTPQTDRWMKTVGASVRELPQLEQYTHPHTVRVGIVSEPNEIRRVRDRLQTLYGPRILCQILGVPGSNDRYQVLEIFDPTVSKWQGILHIARRFEVDPRRIVAVGDDVNDISMIRQAGLGVAMGNARPEVREAADRIIGSNQDDGLAAFLDGMLQEIG